MPQCARTEDTRHDRRLPRVSPPLPWRLAEAAARPQDKLRGRPRDDDCGENPGYRRGRPTRASRSSKPIPRTMGRMAQRQSSRRSTQSLVARPGPVCGRRQASVLIAPPRIDPTAREPHAPPRSEAALEQLRRNALRPETVAPAAVSGPNAAFAYSRIDPLNREPEATHRPGTAFELPGRNALRRETVAPAAPPGPNAAFAPSRTDPLNRAPEATHRPGTAFELLRRNALHRETAAPAAAPAPSVAFAPFRTDLLNREPEATHGADAAFELLRRNALHRETAAPAAAPAQV
jgi:hypothetical protein